MDETNSLEMAARPRASAVRLFFALLGDIIAFLGLIITLVTMWHFIAAAANLLMAFVIVVLCSGPWLIVLAVCSGKVANYFQDRARDLFDQKIAAEYIASIADRRRRENEAHAAEIHVKLTRATYDPNGNAPLLIDIPEHRVYQPAAGQVIQPVPHTYHTTITTPGVPMVTSVTEEQTSQKQLIAGLRIPTFAESLKEGLIGPGQEKVLICYELERDEDAGLLTGRMTPYVDELENNCTMFLGGASKSGKSTLMAHLSAQEAMMNALFYVIDPHLSHPERSIAAKIQALSHAFILPPAQTDAEVYAVLTHAYAEAEARLHGKETRYSGRPIVFIVDEVLNLFGRAQRNPENKDIQALYRDLSHFLRDLGTQYNKYGVNGIFASQYVTKDAFRLPGGVNVDFRDGCQNQTLLRLPANQAQAMRLLQREELRGIRQLAPGHGYMGFYDGSIIRMAAGNVAIRDIEQAGQYVEAAPGKSKQFAVGSPAVKNASSTIPEQRGTPQKRPVQESTEGTAQTPPYAHREADTAPRTERITGELFRTVTPLSEPVQGSTERTAIQKKQFTPEQELQFIHLMKQTPDIKRCLGAMRLGIGTYYTCASELANRLGLRKGS